MNQPPSQPPGSPAEAADLHLRLLRQFDQGWFQQYMALFWRTYYDDNASVAGAISAISKETGKIRPVDKDFYAKELYLQLRDLVNRSETVFVTEDIVHVVETMAKGMPEDMLLPEDVPYDNMLLTFERDIGYDEYEGGEWKAVKIRAIQIAKNQPVRSWGSEPTPGCLITLFTAVDTLKANKGTNSNMIVMDMTGWRFEQMWSTATRAVDQQKLAQSGEYDPHAPHTISPNVALLRKFILTLLRFMQEEIFQVSRHPLSRAQRRRAAREDFAIPDDGCITTVHLRRVHHGNAEHADATPSQWTHRWWVAGHVRHLDHLEPGRTTWVRPHLKGPDGLPLVMKHKVVAVDR